MTESAIAPRKRIFISYARADSAFAHRLAAGLTEHGYEAVFDTQDLPALEDWQRELLVLLQRADTVIFVVSPRSIASRVCKWEIEQMAALNKRLAPVILERVKHDEIPADITRINYLFFDTPWLDYPQAEALVSAAQNFRLQGRQDLTPREQNLLRQIVGAEDEKVRFERVRGDFGPYDLRDYADRQQRARDAWPDKVEAPPPLRLVKP